MSNLQLSDILFDEKGENLAGKDTLAKSSVKRCHAPNIDPREIVAAFLIAMAFIALYVGCPTASPIMLNDLIAAEVASLFDRSEQVPSKGGDVLDRPIDYRSQYE